MSYWTADDVWCKRFWVSSSGSASHLTNQSWMSVIFAACGSTVMMLRVHEGDNARGRTQRNDGFFCVDVVIVRQGLPDRAGCDRMLRLDLEDVFKRIMLSQKTLPKLFDYAHCETLMRPIRSIRDGHAFSIIRTSHSQLLKLSHWQKSARCAISMLFRKSSSPSSCHIWCIRSAVEELPLCQHMHMLLSFQDLPMKQHSTTPSYLLASHPCVYPHPTPSDCSSCLHTQYMPQP